MSGAELDRRCWSILPQLRDNGEDDEPPAKKIAVEDPDSQNPEDSKPVAKPKKPKKQATLLDLWKKPEPKN